MFVFGVRLAVMNLLSDRRKVREEARKHKSVVNVTYRQWGRSPQRWVKINVDTIMFINLNCSGSCKSEKHDSGSCATSEGSSNTKFKFKRRIVLD